MFEVLTVCTGNICRSPLAEQLLHSSLMEHAPRVHSAGTHARPDLPMPDDAVRLAVQLGVAPEAAGAHRSTYLTEGVLASPDLILSMARDHRRHVAELAPARMRHSFTVREFARLAGEVSDEQVRAAADAAGADASARVRAVAELLASFRGLALPPTDPDDDDVIDPYRRSWDTYVLSGDQLAPAAAEVSRILSIAVS